MLEDVQENDEGEYIVKNTSNPIAAECVILLVRGKMTPVFSFMHLAVVYRKGRNMDFKTAVVVYIITILC